MNEEIRLCKGCGKDVTEDMWCTCGDFHLSLSATCTPEEYYVDDDLPNNALAGDAAQPSSNLE
jgi:hypothetical protein